MAPVGLSEAFPILPCPVLLPTPQLPIVRPSDTKSPEEDTEPPLLIARASG